MLAMHAPNYLNALRAELPTLTKAELQTVLSDLPEATADALLYDWALWARDEQLPPAGQWFVWLILAGRGWGKTRTGAEWVHSRMISGRYWRAGLIGQTAADVRDVIVEGESGLLAVAPKHQRPHYEPSKRRLTWPNGAMATTFSGDEPGQLRGPQHDTVWADELAKWRYPQEAWDNMEMGLRLGSNPQVCVTTTPRPIPIIRRLMTDTGTVRPTRNLSTSINRANLAPAFVQRVITKYMGTRLGRQELEAEVLDDTPGALWNRSLIERARVVAPPTLRRIVVAIDPSATSSGDEAGIVVAGLGADQHVYILDDRSLQGSPLEWARAAVAAYHTHRADKLLAESNNGGEMVQVTIQTIAHAPPVTLIHASRGKHTRAQPVASLYEQGKVHHVGAFPTLEDELCSWVEGHTSPNRLDALVWAVTDLVISGGDQFFL